MIKENTIMVTKARVNISAELPRRGLCGAAKDMAWRMGREKTWAEVAGQDNNGGIRRRGNRQA